LEDKPLARPYTLEDVQNTYRILNQAYFEGKLPEVRIKFTENLRYGPHNRAANGATSKLEDGTFLIELDPKMPHNLHKLTLCHEAVHVKLWPRSHRSQAWKAEVSRLSSLGFLHEVF
jgi:hypothetical protein